MKKICKLFCMIFMCFFITACGNVGYKELSYKQLMSKLSNKEDFVLTISSASCINCEMFKGTINDIVNKYEIVTYYIDLDDFTQEERTELKKHFDYVGTPTTINIVDGVEKNNLSRIDGADDYISVKEKLVNWGYIKE